MEGEGKVSSGERERWEGGVSGMTKRATAAQLWYHQSQVR